MLKMRMNLIERCECGSPEAASLTDAETMRHMCTRIEGKGTHDMTYQNTAGRGQEGRGAG